MATLDNTSISNLLIEAIEDRLVQKLSDEQTDAAKARLVRAGRLQQDPTRRNINILVHPGGEDFPDGPDKIMVHESLDDDLQNFTYDTDTVHWLRRFRVELTIFLRSRRDREESREIANVVASRAVSATESMDLTPIPVDNFNERAWWVSVEKLYLSEGGGEGSFNWRGEMWVEFRTERKVY